MRGWAPGGWPCALTLCEHTVQSLDLPLVWERKGKRGPGFEAFVGKALEGDVGPEGGEMALRPGHEGGSVSSGPRVRVERGECPPRKSQR